MPDISDDFVKQLWRQQPVDREVLTLKAVQRKVSKLQRRDRARTIVERITMPMVAAIFIALLLRNGFTWPGMFLFGYFSLLCVWSVWLFRKHEAKHPAPVDSELVSFVDYSIREHQRQSDMAHLSTNWRYFAPWLLLLALICIRGFFVLPADEAAALTVGSAASFAFAQWARLRELRALQSEIVSLETLRTNIVGTR
jgi:hypothetical protein